jgi:hypothetical protein
LLRFRDLKRQAHGANFRLGSRHRRLSAWPSTNTSSMGSHSLAAHSTGAGSEHAPDTSARRRPLPPNFRRLGSCRKPSAWSRAVVGTRGSSTLRWAVSTPATHRRCALLRARERGGMRFVVLGKPDLRLLGPQLPDAGSGRGVQMIADDSR